MAVAVYILCAITSLACAALLVRSYRRQPTRLLMWSTLCFVGLSISNVLLFFDVIVYPTLVDLRLWRLSATSVVLVFLLYGFIWESEDN